jgi:hypothetical protein
LLTWACLICIGADAKCASITCGVYL